jgi:hypothetical protein
MRLHPKHGVNPCIPTCFYCGEGKNEIILLGAMSKHITGHDEAPMHGPCFDKEPCDKCKGYMKQGIILISVDAAKSDDHSNPYRTGCFCVVKEEAVKRWGINSQELLDSILKDRVAFIPDDAWDKIGLPRQNIPAEAQRT